MFSTFTRTNLPSSQNLTKRFSVSCAHRRTVEIEFHISTAAEAAEAAAASTPSASCVAWLRTLCKRSDGHKYIYGEKEHLLGATVA